MSRPTVHFEVFARRKVNAPWGLEMATEDRARALELAEEMMADGRAAAVKVTKEALNEDTREFSTITLMSKGAVESRRTQPVREVDASPLCVAPQDLYSMHARDRIGRLLEGWLRRKGVTTFELLHRADLVEQLDASGVEIQHAIQKIAIPEAQARGVTTHELIRTFQALIDRTMNRVMKDGRKGAFPQIEPANFAAVIESVWDEPERGYLLGGGVAAYLASATSWEEKVDRLLDLAERAPQAGRPRGVALQVLEQPLGEIVQIKGALASLLGLDLDLGGSLAAMMRIAADAEVRALLAFDAGLAPQFPPLKPEAARLAQWLHREAFDSVRSSLTRRVLAELMGPRRLRPACADGEIDVLRALAMALTAAAPRLLPLEDVQAAVIERSKALVGGDFVGVYLVGRTSAAAEVEALVRLAENVAGGVNKRAAARWIVAAVGALRFEKEIRTGAGSTPAKLAGLAALERAIRKIALPAPDEALCLSKLGEIGGILEGEAKLIALIARADGPVTPRLTLLLRLAVGEAGPTGPVAERARAEALRLLRAPDTRAELAAQPGAVEKVKSLLVEAGLAA